MLAKKRKFEKNIKSPKQMERHLKGVANHRRIEILFLIAGNEGITVEDIAERLECNMKTISEHTCRLSRSGLIRKDYKGRAVEHKLSPYGKAIYKFLLTFRHS
ncbi:MAG: MarR family transcriptional regulator [Parcubacteria group bacterium]